MTPIRSFVRKLERRRTYVLRRDGQVIMRGPEEEVLNYLCSVKGDVEEGFTVSVEGVRKKRRSQPLLPKAKSMMPKLPELKSPIPPRSWNEIEQTAIETIRPGKR